MQDYVFFVHCKLTIGVDVSLNAVCLDWWTDKDVHCPHLKKELGVKKVNGGIGTVCGIFYEIIIKLDKVLRC